MVSSIDVGEISAGVGEVGNMLISHGVVAVLAELSSVDVIVRLRASP